MLRSAAARTTLGSGVASAARPKPAAAPFSIPKQNKNPISHAIFSFVKVGCGVELLRGDVASLPHGHSLCVAHLDALRLATLLRARQD
ncbi:hypothetical protein ABKV19_006728 [Rosa sericea]